MEVKYDTPTLVHAAKMREVLHYLENNFKINFFCFSRRFLDSIPFSISTNTSWHVKYKEEYEYFDSFMDIKKIQKYHSFYVWGADGFKNKMEQKMHEERTKSYAIPPGISLIHKSEDYIDSYSFSSSMLFDDRINTILNNSNLLYQFGLSFSQEIEPIIIHFSKKNSYKINTKKPSSPLIDPKQNTLLLRTKPSTKKTFIQEQIFTTRQIECLYCSAQGLSSEQTSRILEISKRTVESILSTCILKLSSSNKYQLIYLATKFGVLREELIAPALKIKIEKEKSIVF